MKKIIIGLLMILGLGCAVFFYLYEYTEVFGKKLIPLKISSMELQYIPLYDIGSGEQFNTEEQTIIDIQSIKLKDSELKKIQSELRDIKKSEEKNEELFTIQYRLILNQTMKINIGDGVGNLEEGNQITPITIPNSLLSQIEEIISKNNQSILKTLSSENIILKLEGASITIKNKDNLKYINESLSYYPIHITEDYKKYDGGYKVSLFLDNNIQVYLYNEHIGYISQKEGDTDTSTYGVFSEDLYNLVYQIYDKSIE